METAAFEHEDLVKELLIEINENLESESAPGQCCIYRVPKDIRRVNEEVYTPQLISIGSLHHGKPELAEMEKKKKKYMKSFLSRTKIDNRDQILSHIKDNEEKIRNCYAETSTLGSLKFVMMILYDSIFIIEMFLRKRFRDRSDTLLDTMPISFLLRTDLQLFENQLPYFIFEEIYKLAFGGTYEPTFMDLSIDFFGAFMGVKLSRINPEVGVKHFTDWRRISLLEGYPPSLSARESVYDLPCAMKLHESGLKFKGIPIEDGRNLFDIRFEKQRHPISFFEVHELQIPNLVIDDETEHLLRNILALEQYLYPKDTQIYSYIELMDYLINTEDDVDLLIGNGIISNEMGDNASVATMFNKLCQYVVARPSSYHKICKQLKEHYKNPWNKVRATLKRVYFNNPWRGTATVAAIILLLLTIAQTVFTILQVV